MDYQFWLITGIVTLIATGIGLILSYLIKYFFTQILTRLDELTREIRLLRESRIMTDGELVVMDKRIHEIETWRKDVEKALKMLHLHIGHDGISGD